VHPVTALTRVHTRRSAPVGAMVVATLVMLAAGSALQLAVFAHHGHTSLSDLPHLVIHRRVDAGHLPYVDRVLEYPVGAGVLLYAATLVAASPMGVLVVTAIAATACCVYVTVRLARRYGTRTWRWALGAGLLLYAFQNWDVFAIAAMVAGILAFERHRDGRAGVAFGVGAAIKLFPGVLVAPLLALRLAQSDRRGARRLVVGAVAAFAALNVPVLVARPSGWWWTYQFQGSRPATWGSAWFYVFRWFGLPVHGDAGAQLADRASFAALLVGVALVTAYARRGRLGSSAIVACSVAVLLLSNKVYSPTYDLWLLPCFVMLPLPRRLWVAFCAIDVAVFVSTYGTLDGFAPAGTAHTVLPSLVAARTVVLIAVIARSLRSGAPARPVPPRGRDRPREPAAVS
jgi:uncharacterized membrane protein